MLFYVRLQSLPTTRTWVVIKLYTHSREQNIRKIFIGK